MDKYFPNGMGPETWTAVRDYMLIRLNQFPNIDNQLRLYTSLEAVHREGTTQLSNLAQVACDLAEAMDVRGPVEQAVLHALDYSPASFLEITWQLTALEVRRVQHQADHLAVCNENEILRQRLFQADALLQRREEDLDLAREMVRAREEGLQRFREVLREKGEELRRTGHILERVEAERDRASNTAEYLRLQLGDLESRLKESQKLRSSAEGCFQSLMSALSKQRVSHGPQARPVVALESAPVTGMSPFAGLPHDHRPMATHSANPESRWAGLFEENAATEAQESEDIPVAMEVAPMTNGDAPVKAPMRPNQVIPAVPKLPPNEVMRANSAKNLEEELDKAEEKVSLPSRATVSRFFLISYRNVLTVISQRPHK